MMRKGLLLGFLATVVVGLMANVGVAQVPLANGTNILACANYNDGPGSSDMTLIVQLEVDGKIVVDEGSTVKYVFMRSGDASVGDSLGSVWVEPAFDDSGWDDGISGVGYSDGDDNTEVKRENASGARDGLTIYTRYHFEVTGATANSVVTLRTDYDDQFAAWLNGVEVARSAWLEGKDLTWNVNANGTDNHGSTESPKGTPNANRAYQNEIDVPIIVVSSVAVEPTGKIATSWASLKALY